MTIDNWIAEISYILGIVGNFALFMILFIPKGERKKTNIILSFGIFCMLVVHQIMLKSFHMSLANAGVLFMGIPSFILCFLLSEFKDGRFIFTFCLPDILYVIIRIIAAATLSLSTNTLIQPMIELSVKIILLGLVIFGAWKFRFTYERFLRTMDRGWGLLAWESVLSYFFFYLLVAYSEKIHNRPASLLMLLSYSVIVLVTYLVIFKLVIQISKTQAEEAKNQLLETQLKLQESELMVKQLYQEMAYKDQLTGIGNRAAFEEHMDGAAQENRDIAVFVFDINGLKHVNDTFGHVEGDYLIKQVASILGNVFKPDGTIYRVGGDEFVVIMEPKLHFDWIQMKDNVAIALDKAKEAEFLNKPYHGTVSAGCSIIEKADREKIQKGLILADQMMYEEKKAYGELKKLI